MVFSFDTHTPKYTQHDHHIGWWIAYKVNKNGKEREWKKRHEIQMRK